MKTLLFKIFKYINIILIIIIVCFCFHKSAYAYSTTQYPRSQTFQDGRFYFVIEDGLKKNSRIQIRVYRNTPLSWKELNDASSLWSVEMIGGTNNHNICLQTTSVYTKKDTTPEWNILNISLAYDMPAHYVYQGEYFLKSPPRSRLNFKSYTQANNGENTAFQTGYHAKKIEKRVINLQINATQIGLRTYYNKRYQDVTLAMKIGLPQRQVNYVYRYQNAVDSTWKTFQNQTIHCLDTQKVKPFSTQQRQGYHLDQSFHVYENGHYQEAGIINQDEVMICGGDKTIYIDYYPNQYKNLINHEAMISHQKKLKLSQISFSSLYGVTYQLTKDHALIAPNGFELSPIIHTSSLDLLIHDYALPLSVTQKAQDMIYEFDYVPKIYTITYDLNGGQWVDDYPTSYTVLDGCVLSTPVRLGYQFAGWYHDNQKVTSLNKEKLNFIDANDFYHKLQKRTTGHIHLQAKWTKLEAPKLYVYQNCYSDRVPFHDKQCDFLVVLKGDKFDPFQYVKAWDQQDGDLTSSVEIVKHNIPLDQGCVYQTGHYEITYSVENSFHMKTQKDMKVFVNEIPIIISSDRYMLENQITLESLFSQMAIVDKEEGILFRGSEIQEDLLNHYIEENIAIHHPIIQCTLKNTRTGNCVIFDDLMTNRTITLDPKCQDYIIDVDVSDSHYAKAHHTFHLYTYKREDISSKLTYHARFIRKSYLDTLDVQSIWKTNKEYYHILASSMNRSQPLYQYSFSKDHINKIKKENTIPSQMSNLKFIWNDMLKE